MSLPVTVDTLFKMADQLSVVDKVRLIERIAPQITRDLKKNLRKPRKSLRGIWRGVNITVDDIEQVRAEMWKNFPREDI